MQVIASAGSGKREVVAQRFAQLMSDGADPAGIIAFTFTERAADELKARTSARVEERLGPVALDKLGAAFVGTIHSYGFRVLQQHVPPFETFDALDERRLTAFLCREEPASGGLYQRPAVLASSCGSAQPGGLRRGDGRSGNNREDGKLTEA
jgi:DNA helicase-2/ATP-dependent DNA helicase PcrA